MDTIGHYYAELGRIPLLDKDDEVRLAKIIEAGREAEIKLETAKQGGYRAVLHRRRRAGHAAREEFIRANLRLVVSVATRISHNAGRGVELADLIQDGNLGLQHAVDLFDWRKGFKFSTYATWWIRQSIDRGLGVQLSPMHAPHVFSTRHWMVRAMVLEGATVDDVAEALEISYDRALGVIRSVGMRSIDAPLTDEGDGTLVELVPGETDAWTDRVADGVDVAELVGGLPEPHRSVIVRLYGLNGIPAMTPHEVADDLGIGYETVRRYRDIALRALRLIAAPSEDVFTPST